MSDGFVLTAGGVLPPGFTAEEMALRWTPEETQNLETMKSALEDELSQRPINAVSSERRMLRFLKRFSMDVGRAIESYREHLVWRAKNKVDAMHDRIVEEQLTPSTIPHGAKVLEMLPQVPCHPHYVDRLGNPISIEYYGFHPGELPLLP